MVTADLLLVAADIREFDGLLPHCKGLRRLEWPLRWAREGELNGQRVWLAANGVGAAFAAEAVDVARASGSVGAVVSTGFCGALEKGMKIGDIFAANGIEGMEGPFAVSSPVSGRAFLAGPLVSIDRIAQTAAEKRKLRQLGALAVDMEAAGVALRARDWGVPLFCVRSITDLADEDFTLDLNSALGADGRFHEPRLLRMALERPVAGFAELIRLWDRSRKASRSLGDFIASCRF